MKNDSPVSRSRHLAGKKVATTSGSIYDRWIKRCFPSTERDVTDSFTNALLAFNQGRADALMWDDTVLVGVAAADPSAKLTNDTFLALPYGIGIKQGNVAAEALGRLAARADAEEGHVHADPQEQRAGPLRAGFSKNILRPNNTFGYAPPGTPSADTVCP